MDHEQIPEAEGVQRLLASALHDVTLDGDVVPGVLDGYRRHVATRRWQTAGGALAVLAVAAVGVSVLPGSTGDGRPVAPASATKGDAYPTGAFQNEGCTQHWTTSQLDFANHKPAAVPAGDPARERAFCEALTAAVKAGAPDADFVPQQFPADLTKDTRIDQKQFADFLAVEQATSKPGVDWTPPPQWKDFADKIAAEYDYMRQHPENPANRAEPNVYTLSTPMGTATFQFRFENGADGANGDAIAGSVDCDGARSAHQGYGTCTAVSVGGWHGTVIADDQPGHVYLLAAALTDGKGHYLRFDSTGTDDVDWGSLPPANTGGGKQQFLDGDKTVDVNRWTNRRTGQTATGSFPPVTPALTVEQFIRLVQNPRFADLVDHALPAYAGWHAG